MVSAIVGLAHNFSMDVVAEGVETAEQLAAVQRLGCDYAQGFYFSKAIDAAAVEPLIAAQPWRPVATTETRESATTIPVHSDAVN
jgi:EAL domain-containing protein (putative c-di-GMP-specific phosphodiesterase class I)